MKIQVTRKSIKEAYPRIISAGYCALQHLLWYQKPVAYTASINGWDNDVYEFDSVAIVTGHRPFGDTVPRELIQKYESAAKEVFDSGLPYEEKKRC